MESFFACDTEGPHCPDMCVRCLRAQCVKLDAENRKFKARVEELENESVYAGDVIDHL